ncbi:hypothetical protein EG329_005098 [Mollisiaceae sp. DMI_Dod_QoI]|nr:hypothetical protein EG329_005098 [Helotiales sp. DMI_Dod_QoI]
MVTQSPDDMMEKGKAARQREASEEKNVLFVHATSPESSRTTSSSKRTDGGQRSLGSVVQGEASWFRGWTSCFRASRRDDVLDEDLANIRRLEDCPEGYPQLAAFLESDEHFMLYRRFGFLQGRLILYKQDELRQLETELNRLDDFDNRNDKSLHRSREKDDARSGKRKELMGKIEAKFREYISLLISARNLAEFDIPLDRDYMTVMKYFLGELPLCDVESYIFKREDIITLLPSRDTTWLDAAIEKALEKVSCRCMQYIFSPKRFKRKADPKNGVVLYSRRRIDVLVTLIVLTIIAILLIIPVYIVWRLTRNTQAVNSISLIMILLVFTLVFCLVLLKFTRAKRHEILAAAAAYCAVLVTFMGNVGQIAATASS